VTADAGRPARDIAPLQPDLRPILDAVTTAAAAGFVAVGADADRRYLTGLDASTPGGVVVVPSDGPTPPRATCCVPPDCAIRAEEAFVDAALDASRSAGTTRPDARAFHDGVVRQVVAVSAADPTGLAVASVLSRDYERGGGDAADGDESMGSQTGVDASGARDGDADGPTVLVPRSIPHDAALYLERAGFAVASTTAVRDARAQKRPRAVDRIRRAQRAAAAAMARAETMLARATVARRDDAEVDTDAMGDTVGADGVATDDTADPRPVCRLDGESLTVGRLRRAVHATLATRGMYGDRAVVAAGPASVARRPPIHDAAPVRPGTPVVVSITPRGPSGYHGRLTRTFVVDGDGGWDRRAYVAVEAAQAAALAEVTPGTVAAAVGEEAAAEIAAYGFDPAADRTEPDYVHDAGGGIGLSAREPPSLASDSVLRAGHTLAVEPGVSHPAHGGVRLGDVVVVTDDGAERLVEYPFGTTPAVRSADGADDPVAQSDE
jgi:Xaa-Pro aminopeptidase